MNDFIYCGTCLFPRDMSRKGLVEKCVQCGDGAYIRSDYITELKEPETDYTTKVIALLVQHRYRTSAQICRALKISPEDFQRTKNALMRDKVIGITIQGEYTLI